MHNDGTMRWLWHPVHPPNAALALFRVHHRPRAGDGFPVSPRLPSVPVALPAQLLERRPDIAAAERRMAAANEQIGIAQAAYYPTLNLAAVAGLEGSSLLNWFNWPSRFLVGRTVHI
jgi:outer membrane protein TolC